MKKRSVLPALLIVIAVAFFSLSSLAIGQMTKRAADNTAAATNVGMAAAQTPGSMYVTIRRYEGVTDSKEVSRRVKEGFVPLISSIPGFIAYYWVDAGGGVTVSTSVFESKAAAEESNQKAADWVKKNLAALAPNPPQITAGTVVAYKAK